MKLIVFVLYVGQYTTGDIRIMSSPIVSNLVFSLDGRASALDESTAFLQIISFPKSHVWIWIGNRDGAQHNLSLAMGPRQSNQAGIEKVISSYVLNSANPDEASVHGKGLAERISKKLGGKPVYLSCNFSTHSIDDQFLNILEKQVMVYIKTHPEIF